MTKTESKGIACIVLGFLTGFGLGSRAWFAWRSCLHGIEHSLALGLVAAGIVIVGVDATFRLHTREARERATWSDVAFDASVGARIDGWPAWMVGALLSAVATTLISSF